MDCGSGPCLLWQRSTFCKCCTLMLQYLPSPWKSGFFLMDSQNIELLSTDWFNWEFLLKVLTGTKSLVFRSAFCSFFLFKNHWPFHLRISKALDLMLLSFVLFGNGVEFTCKIFSPYVYFYMVDVFKIRLFMLPCTFLGKRKPTMKWMESFKLTFRSS